MREIARLGVTWELENRTYDRNVALIPITRSKLLPKKYFEE